MGGGDTANLVRRFGMQKDVTYISTGGGASVEFIQGLELPGVTALSEPHELE
jgi:3-phosphoglycerate kinase